MISEIPYDGWPKNLNEHVAMIRLGPEDITKATGIKFYEDYDDLDYFRVAICSIDGLLIGLLRYKNSPAQGTIILTEDGWYSPSTSRPALVELIKKLGASESDLSWVKEV